MRVDKGQLEVRVGFSLHRVAYHQPSSTFINFINPINFINLINPYQP